MSPVSPPMQKCVSVAVLYFRCVVHNHVHPPPPPPTCGCSQDPEIDPISSELAGQEQADLNQQLD